MPGFRRSLWFQRTQHADSNASPEVSSGLVESGLLDGFVPGTGDTFDALTADNKIALWGAFCLVQAAGLPPSLSF